MHLEELALTDVKLLTPKKFGDNRGFFSETYSQQTLATAAGVHLHFVQDNQSLSETTGTVRALHYQVAPFTQGKLVRVLRGSILDVAVDIRRGSRTFGRHVAAVISAENWKQIYVPPGFAHGFVTLEPATEVFYKVTAPYSPASERSILWNDPELAIDWRTDPADAVLSDKDRVAPLLKNVTELL